MSIRGIILTAILALILIACQAAPPAPAARTGEGPTGTGAVQYEPGFSAFCRANPGVATCPPR